MAIFRRPVSQRRKASRPYKARGPASKSPRSTFKRIDTNKGTNPAHMVVHRGIGLPDKFRTRLIWNQAVVLTGFSSALTQSYAVRLNGPYDPQVALGGSQPQYYDMLASMYSTYMVRGAKISCTFSPTTSSTAGDGPYVVGVKCGRGAALVTTNPSILTQMPNTGHTIMSPNGNSVTVTQTFSPKQLEPDGEGDDLQSQTSTTPTRQWYANVFATPLGVSVAGSVSCMITVEYLVDFFELNNNVLDN